MRIVHHIEPNQLAEILRQAKDQLLLLKDGGRIVKQGGAFGDLTNDTELAADKALGEFFRETIDQLRGVCRVTVEGLTEDLTRTISGLWVTVDPIDGSLNYKMRGETPGEPHTSVVTVLSDDRDVSFDHVVLAGLNDLRRGSDQLWLTWKDEDGYHSTLNGQPLKTLSDTKLDIGKQIVMVETYYPSNRDLINKIFAGQKGNLSRYGSAAYEMAQVATGKAAAFICDQQKQHELGMAYALVKGAGGVALDFDGKDLGSRVYNFKTQTPCILAANQEISLQLLDLIHKS